MKKWLINPFYYLAGIKSLLIGMLIIVVTSLLCTLSTSHMNGVLDFHPKTGGGNFFIFLIENLINLISISAVLYIIGVILSKSSIRIIDVIGTQALARFPYLWAPLIGIFAPDPRKLLGAIHNKQNASTNIASITGMDITLLLVFSLLSLAILVWIIVLMYKAYSVSCNLKNVKGVVSFVIGLLLSEFLSKFMLGTFLKYFN